MINLHIFQPGRIKKDSLGYYEILELQIFPDPNQWLFNKRKPPPTSLIIQQKEQKLHR